MLMAVGSRIWAVPFVNLLSGPLTIKVKWHTVSASTVGVSETGQAAPWLALLVGKLPFQ